MMENQKEAQFLGQQKERLERRIRYAQSVINAGGPHAVLKAQTLSSLIRARTKIALGSYFQCDDCDGTISKKRLQNIPGATRCGLCQHHGEALLH